MALFKILKNSKNCYRNLVGFVRMPKDLTFTSIQQKFTRLNIFGDIECQKIVNLEIYFEVSKN